MLIRTSIFAIALVLSGCGSDPASMENSDNSPASQRDTVGTQDPALEAPTQSDANIVETDTAQLGEEFETASGLLYEVLSPAQGPKPSASSVVTLHYIGTLNDGTVFDSSIARGEPSTFGLANTIEGFKEGVQLMSVGSRYRFTLPANIAYGDQGVGRLIGPGDTLNFEVELLEINSN